MHNKEGNWRSSTVRLYEMANPHNVKVYQNFCCTYGIFLAFGGAAHGMNKFKNAKVFIMHHLLRK